MKDVRAALGNWSAKRDAIRAGSGQSLADCSLMGLPALD